MHEKCMEIMLSLSTPCDGIGLCDIEKLTKENPRLLAENKRLREKFSELREWIGRNDKQSNYLGYGIVDIEAKKVIEFIDKALSHTERKEMNDEMSDVTEEHTQKIVDLVLKKQAETRRQTLLECAEICEKHTADIYEDDDDWNAQDVEKVVRKLEAENERMRCLLFDDPPEYQGETNEKPSNS